ncbi:MAG TPA: class I adenylate-forming enzyme family protein [Ramlibacter sp.]|uniref:class I adenylate-forming enzyme family protein n=1 Tax=Ramlibacter sp. TaxID=1917967 RepID=UPI002C426A06|nr:class I adenylate-forming enzyme family protein [Ramlibacter sp.]HVZ43281.1 class I adenylate-forming enzyme family protein [Ramlibacter sp.]
MNIVEPIHEHARAKGDAPAVFLRHRRVTWRELSEFIDAAAVLFRRRGLAAGQRVGLCCEGPLLHLVAALGLAQAGVAHVALPAGDLHSARQRIIDKLRLDAVIADKQPVLESQPNGLLFDRVPKFPAKSRPEVPPPHGDADMGWLILQSSGTTGEPKFAELSHALSMARFERFPSLYGCGPDDVFWPVSRLEFVVAKQRAVCALQAGAAVCLAARGPITAELLDFLRRSGVTLACGTPLQMHNLLALVDQTQPLPALRAFEVRSATVSERLRREFREKFCPGLHVVYGTNEGEALAIASPELQSRVRDTVGVATPSMEIQVVDPDGVPLAPGGVGEVRARGAGVVSRYIDNAEATARSFRDGWFHPGDIAFMTAEGAVVLQGRKDDMMICDGMNIYPAEIENALLEHPAVKEAAAYPIKHPQAQDMPAAAVTLESPATEQELIRHCRERIGLSYPRVVRIMDELPRNPMGKVLKRKLSAEGLPAA